MMAQTIPCDLCREEPAVTLETNVETGEVVAVGLACIIPFYIGGIRGLADMLTGEDGAQYGPAITELFNLPIWRPIDTSPPPPAAPPPAAPLAGTDDASVSGEGIPVTPDGGPQLDGGHGDGGQAADGGQPASPARRARDRTRTPR